MRILLMLNGQPPSRELTKSCFQHSDFVVGADNGAYHLINAGVEPDRIIGDIDSIAPELARQFIRRINQVDTQENTDFEKSLIYIYSDYPSADVTILGATGRRMDHELGNLLCAANWADRLNIRLISDDEMICFPSAGKQFELRAKQGQIISLFGLPEAAGVSTCGLKWPLCDETLPMGTRGVSNEAMSPLVTFKYRSGRLIVVQMHEGIDGINWEW